VPCGYAPECGRGGDSGPGDEEERGECCGWAFASEEGGWGCLVVRDGGGKDCEGIGCVISLVWLDK
jgi:hypothetical protein